MDPVRVSADVALLAFLIAWLLRVYPNDRHQNRVEPWAYGLGGVLMVVHVLIAYGMFHHWSHASALAHTAQQTERVVGWSFGGGLYFNFVFVLVYLTDIVWRNRCGGWKNRRPHWLAVGVDLFLWFIVAMSTIVFETGVVRMVAVAGLLAVIAARCSSAIRLRRS